MNLTDKLAIILSTRPIHVANVMMKNRTHLLICCWQGARPCVRLRVERFRTHVI